MSLHTGGIEVTGARLGHCWTSADGAYVVSIDFEPVSGTYLTYTDPAIARKVAAAHIAAAEALEAELAGRADAEDGAK